MNTRKDDWLKALISLFPKEQLHTDPADCWVYGYDNSRRHALPDAVVFALSHDDVEKVVRFCLEYSIPLTARGRASSTTGSAVPLQGGIVLSLERMQKILRIEPENRLMVVEPGVLNSHVQAEAQAHGFFWPPDPTSSPYCTIGGNLACNAAGPRSIKYGTARDNTLGLTAVIGTGETIQCGTFTTKSSVGYDLTRLFIGSEGTLGIITSATLKLTPLPSAKRTLRLYYKDMVGAAQAVTQIMSQGVTPCACEFIDGNAIDMIRRHAHADLPVEAQSMVMIEVDGTEDSVDHDAQQLKRAAHHESLLDVTIAANPQEAAKLWVIRKSLSQALRSLSPHKINEDVVVPLAAIPELLNYTQSLSQQFATPIVNFGHAGNGNIHVNILMDPNDPIKGPQAHACLNLLFDKVIDLKGSLSGEHGIGIEKRDYIKKEFSTATLNLMQRIKQQCDPKGILNPGKLFTN